MRDKPLSQPPLNRRQLITASLATLCGLAYWRAPLTSPDDAAALAARIVRLLGFRPTQPATTVTADALAGGLASVLGVDRSALPQYALLTDRKLRKHIQSRIRLNYRTGAMIPVHGWWLSATEFHALNLAEQLQCSVMPNTARSAQDNRQIWQPQQNRPRHG